MTAQRNIPDRIKLTIQFVVFTLATCFVLFLLLVLLPEQWVDHLRDYRKLILLGICTVSILIQGVAVTYRWKKLIQQENVGDLPDMNDMRNITSRQIILFVMGFPFLIVSVVLFQLYSKLAGILCFIPYLVMWGFDIAYVKRRFRKINEGKSME